MIALIDDPAVIRRVLQHLRLPTEVPEARPARAPPVPLLDGAPCSGDAPDGLYVDDPVTCLLTPVSTFDVRLDTRIWS